MKFFDSEIIQQEMQEIAELQDTIYKNVFTFPDMDDDGQIRSFETSQNFD